MKTTFVYKDEHRYSDGHGLLSYLIQTTSVLVFELIINFWTTYRQCTVVGSHRFNTSGPQAVWKTLLTDVQFYKKTEKKRTSLCEFLKIWVWKVWRFRVADVWKPCLYLF